ncbi:unnamed protein product [Candidula unifasciata]|uniref:Uncharacterized protein n=1 Tax=Candidula unifasciata TaxID=100452 RepID=A0A8S3YPB5_9EUPU|nr:unnamed protein product [Candidula unifasciata]
MLKMVISVAACLAYLCLATEGAAVSSNQVRQGNFNVPNRFGPGHINNLPNAADPCPHLRFVCDRTTCGQFCKRMGYRNGMCRAKEVSCGQIVVDKKQCTCTGDFLGAKSAYAGEGSSSNATNSDVNNSNSSDSSAAETPRNRQETSTAPASNATTAAPKAAGVNSANLAPAS